MSQSTELNPLENLNILNELSEHVILRINTCSEIYHPEGWSENKHHRDYDLWYLQEGQLEIRVHGQVHLASEGDLILFSPKVAYTATALKSGCRFTFTHFDFGIGNHLRILDNFQLSGILHGSLVHEELELFLDTYDKYKNGALLSGIRLKGCLTILIAKIIESYGTGKYRGGFTFHARGRAQTLNLKKLQPIFDFIQDHLHQPLRVVELASMLDMSEKYFITYFKNVVGVTPGLYIYELKMNRARDLLYNKKRYSMQQIASMIGYPDAYSFSKAFKKYYQVPPSQFVR